MAGLIAVAGAGDGAAARQQFDRGRARLLRNERRVIAEWESADGRLLGGHAPFPHAVPADTAARTRIDTPRVVFHGVLYNRDELARETPVETLEALLSALYVRFGDDFVSRLEGEFAVLVLDPARRRLLAATDLAGNYPIYWQAGAHGGVVSTDLSALLAARGDSVRLDLKAVADYLTSGMVLGTKTLAAGVHTLRGGTLLTYDADRGVAQVVEYASPAALFAKKTAANKDDYLEAVDDAFTTAVRRAIGGGDGVGVSLSGGLDSRAILSAAGAHGRGLTTYTLGVEGCADQVIGNRLAQIAGTRHTFFALRESYLGEFMPNLAEMIALTGGMYLSHGLTEMLALRFLDQVDISVLLRGHGGELAKAHLAWPLHTDRRVYELGSARDVIPYLANRVNYITPRLPLSELLLPAAAAAAGDGARQSFAEALADTPLSPADCCSYLYLSEHHRRFTIPSLELFRSKVEVRLPFVDRAFLQTLLAAPPEWRDSTTIHRKITASGLSPLARVRDSNTGAPANAGAATTYVLDKMNSLLKRLNVTGYRHYHNFDGWMRRTLLDSVEAELMGDAARVRTFIQKAALERVLRETREGAADHSYLLQVLLILELWQREHHVEAAA